MDKWLGRWEFKIFSLSFGQSCWALKNRIKKSKEREREEEEQEEEEKGIEMENREHHGVDEKKNLGEEKERPIEEEK